MLSNAVGDLGPRRETPTAWPVLVVYRSGLARPDGAGHVSRGGATRPRSTTARACFGRELGEQGSEEGGLPGRILSTRWRGDRPRGAT